MIAWDHIKSLLEVVKAGNFQAASAHTNISTSTIQRHIKKLERECNAALFVRNAHTQTLTEFGRCVVTHAEQACKHLDKINTLISGTSQQLRGILRIAVCGPVLRELLAPHLVSFHQKYPQIQLRLKVDDEGKSLTTQQADVAIRITASPPQHLIGRKIMDAPWVVCASNKYLMAHPAPGCFSDLNHHDIVTLDHETVDIDAFSRFNDMISLLNPKVICSDSFDAHIELLRAGAGVGLMERPLLNKIDCTALFEFQHPNSNALWILYSKDNKQSLVSVFSQYICNAIHSELKYS